MVHRHRHDGMHDAVPPVAAAHPDRWCCVVVRYWKKNGIMLWTVLSDDPTLLASALCRFLLLPWRDSSVDIASLAWFGLASHVSTLAPTRGLPAGLPTCTCSHLQLFSRKCLGIKMVPDIIAVEHLTRDNPVLVIIMAAQGRRGKHAKVNIFVHRRQLTIGFVSTLLVVARNLTMQQDGIGSLRQFSLLL